jgi:putative endonuclease
MSSTTETGRRAEQAAATYLEMRGYQVLERNWRRPRCEIDIIAQKSGVIYFVEVKYRRNDEQGGGLEAITPTKLKRMRYAAMSWREESEYFGESQLAAVEIAPPNYTVLSFIDNVF